MQYKIASPITGFDAEGTTGGVFLPQQKVQGEMDRN
jgi:hypothetical protein